MRLVAIWFLVVFLFGTWGCTSNTQPTGQSQDLVTGSVNATAGDQDKVPHLLPAEPAIQGTITNRIIEDTVDRLDRLKPGNGMEQDQAIATLAQHDDDAVAEIERQLVNGDRDYGWGHAVVRVLGAIDTEKARTLLRRMALGEFCDVDINKAWAAQKLIAYDRGEASNLLASTDPEVIVDALNVMEGQPIDDKLMVLLKKCLDNKELEQRLAVEDMTATQRELTILNLRLAQRSTAMFMAAGTTGELANEAVEAIGKALSAVADLPEVDALLPLPSKHPGTEHTLGEQYYYAYAGALASANVDDQTLHDLAKQLHGRAKDAVILALAWRSDKSVHEDLVKVVQDVQAGLLRAWAVRALGEISTQDDLPFLRTLAENDTLIREGPVSQPLSRGPGDVSVGSTHPVCEAAKDAILAIEARANEEENK